MPPITPTTLTQTQQQFAAQLNDYFPLDRAPISPRTFEIGLALAGTVSAGAYTAGVLDYLMEALDAWSDAKAKGDPDAPPHNVAISTVAGASGGAINGAILLRAASFEFPNGAADANPFFNAWAGANCVTLERLLAPGLSQSGMAPVAMLNTSAIEQQASAILNFDGPLRSRPFLTNPLRLIATIGNVTGIPYSIDFRGDTNLGLSTTLHSDYVRFALSVTGGCARPDSGARNDEYALSGSSPANWNFVRDAVLATSAFPIAFDARAVERTVNQLAYRAVLVPGAPGESGRMMPIAPSWETFPDLLQRGATTATAVDGGTMDNEPIGVARRELAGFVARNPRKAKEAHRAVILIDPFADAAKLPAPPRSLFDISGQVLNLFLQQARYNPEDLALAKAETKFSRFLIAPRADAVPASPGAPGAPPVEGSGALNSGQLGGFLGFLDERLMKHDFELGRYDAFLFLTRDFRVPASNVVIAANPWTAEQRRTYTTGPLYDYDGQPPNERAFLPLIPLVAKLRNDHPQAPVRPIVDSAPDSLRAAIDARLDFVFARLLDEFSSTWTGVSAGLARTALKSAWALWGRRTVCNKAMATLQQALKPPTP